MPWLGVFDSGTGGENALAVLRRLLPRADLLFFADRENAPYGTKSKEELIALTSRDAALLYRRGAERVLIACCTAGSVYPYLDEQTRGICFPVIRPTARAACLSHHGGAYAVLATERTVADGCFVRAIRGEDPEARVLQFPAQAWVSLIEAGHTDDPLAEEQVRAALSPALDAGCRTVVVGCTHFSSFLPLLHRLYPGIAFVSSAGEGARAFAGAVPPALRAGAGKTLVLPPSAIREMG